MNQLQAVLLVVAFLFAVSLAVAGYVLFVFIRFEIQARLRKRAHDRARKGFVVVRPRVDDRKVA